jgi:hypothetical protein
MKTEPPISLHAQNAASPLTFYILYSTEQSPFQTLIIQQSSHRPGNAEPEDKSNAILRNIGNYLPVDTT